MKQITYDVIVIGGGAAGLVAAKLAAGLGKSVAIIEKNKLGGECTWTGCIPSKTLIHLAGLAAAAKKFAAYQQGGQKDGVVDSAKIMEQVRATRAHIAQGTTPESLHSSGIDTFFGDAHFVDLNAVKVDGNTLHFKKCILATGSHAFVPPIEGLAQTRYLTNSTLFELEELPADMTILGGGPIGVEMACALNSLGVKVTVLEMNMQILAHEDEQVSALLAQHMIAQGIEIKTSMTLQRVVDGTKLVCRLADGSMQDFTCSRLLVAVGRRPNVEALGLEAIGVNSTSRGITVNNKLQTTLDHIYACGDVVGPYQFSHMAEYQAVIAARNACVPVFKTRVNYAQKIWVTFSSPELARLGLTEQEARAAHGNRIQIFCVPYSTIDRSAVDDATLGLCKVICDARGYIIGAHILGARAGELIHELQLGVHYKVRFKDFYKVIHAYPTYSELLWHGGRMAYLQWIRQNFFIKMISWFMMKNKIDK